MIYVFLGPSGAGKDTQIRILQEKLGIPNISSGEILRKAYEDQTKDGLEAAKYWKNGKWVPDDLMYKLFLERVSRDDCKNGFIANGFPRTKAQIQMLDKIAKALNQEIAKVVLIEVTPENLIARLEKALRENPNDPWVNRDDAKPEILRARLKSFYDTIEPIVEEYEKRGLLAKIDGSQSVEEVAAQVEKALGL